MKLPVTYSELDVQRKRMNAPLADWKFNEAGLNPREQFLKELLVGIVIKLDDVDVGPGRLLTYQGEQIILYIKDTRSSQWILENEPEKSKRFHVADCSALERMRSEGRFERYVATNDTNGLFLVDWLDPETRERGETKAALKVCKNCLSALNWRGYEQTEDRFLRRDETRKSRNEIWKEFEIAEFLLDYSTFFRTRPGRRDTDATLNEYVEDWPKISKRKRQEIGWRCEKCGVILSDNPGLLHVHHLNGVVTDNSSRNLKVLCALDHADQPGHQHMRVTQRQRRIIQNARKQQGIA